MRSLAPVCAAAFLLVASAARRAEAGPSPPLTVAAAANLVYALEALDSGFAREAADVKVSTVVGASGSLVAQIQHGAPYDLFLSADLDFAQKLAKTGDGVSSSMFTFAVGRLVIWTTNPEVRLASAADSIRSPSVRKIAIANPAQAPYGRAARQALGRLGLLESAQPRFVIGENITQTAQFVQTGNADLGFVALSLVLSPKLKGLGSWIEVPTSLYDPLEQEAILTRRGASNPSAVRYLDYLRGPQARRILEQFGYEVPHQPDPPAPAAK